MCIQNFETPNSVVFKLDAKYLALCILNQTLKILKVSLTVAKYHACAL